MMPVSVLASLLGLLAFFEPCTLALHALYMERAGRGGWKSVVRAAGTVWMARLLLAILPLLMLVLLAPPLVPTPLQAAAALVAMGLLYLVSRRHYLPVPHLELHRVIPGGERLPQGVRLGLTLPACTLPLYVVLAGTVLWLYTPVAAVAGGFLFATFFTLPLLVTSPRMGRKETARLLARLAAVAPWVTAVLLFAAAAWLAWPVPGIDTGGLEEAVARPGWSGLGLAFLAGLVFSFNPVSFAAIPVALAYVTRAGDRRQALWQGGAFVAGLLLTHVLLGGASALGGEWVRNLMGRHWGVVLGPVLILLGLMWAGALRLRLPWPGLRGRRIRGAGGAFLLAMPFSVAVCPFCAPALLVVITASAAIGSAGYGMALLLAFALGRSIPILIGAWSLGWLETLAPFSRYHRHFEVAGGLVLVLSGLYLLNGYFFWVDLGPLS